MSRVLIDGNTAEIAPDFQFFSESSSRLLPSPQGPETSATHSRDAYA